MKRHVFRCWWDNYFSLKFLQPGVEENNNKIWSKNVFGVSFLKHYKCCILSRGWPLIYFYFSETKSIIIDTQPMRSLRMGQTCLLNVLLSDCKYTPIYMISEFSKINKIYSFFIRTHCICQLEVTYWSETVPLWKRVYYWSV